MSVRVRFAPSPTGYLHIGGVRTALFNWLFARRHGGAFILRIDDTDAQRNLEAALAPILAGFRWLGIDWDEGPLFQSQRQEGHRAAVKALLDAGHAYWDYARPDERGTPYDRRFAALSDDDRRRFEAEGRTGAVRLKMPRDGTCRFRDLVREDVEFEWAREQDHVIQRADGTCLYHLASVVDDRDLRITHVIRAEEHLPNTPRQIFIARGLGVEPPHFAHLPAVAEPGSKAKLSKRKIAQYLKNPAFKQLHERGRGTDDVNPVMVDFYEKAGFLPEAIVNYLLLLGWSLDDKTEFFAREEMVANFSLERVGKSSASFDPEKLLAFQDRYFREAPLERKLEMVRRFQPRADATLLEAAGDRIKIAADILDYDWAYSDDFAYDEAAFQKRVRGAADHLRAYRDELPDGGYEAHMNAFVEKRGIKVGQIIHAVRVAVTGKSVGFGLYETLDYLGRERVIARLNRATERER